MVRTLFLDAPFDGKVELCADTLTYLKEKQYKKVALYASVQFCNQLDKVKEQLQALDIEIVSSQPKRTGAQHQILGCDNYHDSFNVELSEVDAYLYIGDGKFHPLALVYAQKDNNSMKEVLCNDPIAGSFSLMGVDDISTILKKYKGSLIKFLSSDTIGVIITIKPGQEQMKPSFFLEKKFPDKKFYYFIDNNVSFDQLENFPFVEVWVNTACPRVGFDDQEKFVRGVLNLNDALLAKEILSKESLLTRV
jgi:2-(3-amino-3-carboxypropyl)histidine synthase